MRTEHFIKSNPFFRFNNPEALGDIIKKYRQPLFIYSKKTIEHQYETLRKLLPEKFKIFYAQKSNPNIEILKFISGLGAGCDTASAGEIKSAFNAGFSRDLLMFTGPGKRTEEIEYAVGKGIMSINVESIQELILIDETAGRAGKKQDILVRINPPYEAGEDTKIIGGTGVSKFGIDIEQIDEFFRILKKTGYINLKGIHIFNSSQILDWQSIYHNTKNVIDTALWLSSKYKFYVTHIDLGGGFGIPYNINEQEIEIISLGKELKKLIESDGYNEFLENVNLIFEPGRYLSGPAGIYLMKVLYTKNSRGKGILIADGGIHHLVRPALIGQAHPIINLTGYLEERKKDKEYMVAGPLCTSLDCFDENAMMCETKQGDILAVLNAGAYGYTESMPMFLTHPPAEEMFLD